jgi:hypothetical protein
LNEGAPITRRKKLILPKRRRGKNARTQIDGLNHIVCGAAEFTHVVAVHKEQVAFLAASDNKVGYGTTRRLVDKDRRSTGAEIDIIAIER